MSLLYPQFLWLLLPLALLVLKCRPRRVLTCTHAIIILLLILTLSRPRIEQGESTRPIEAKDILIALDISYSMQAEDIAPNRYTYARKVIDALLTQNPNDNIMLIAFTTNPLLLSPPTTDHRLVRTALEALQLKNILTKGTSLEHLFRKIASLEPIEREVVLLTDGGEEHTLTPLADALAHTPMHLHILALGTTRGTPIPQADGTMLKDEAGNLVVSRINPLLRKLAHTLEGDYFEATDSPQKIAARISETFKKQRRTTIKKHYAYTELYMIPLLLAIILFFLLHTRFVRYLILLFALFGVELHASFFDLFKLQSAYAHYRQEEYNATRSILLEIEHPSLQQQFALANTDYRQHRYKEAIARYRSIRSHSPKIKQKLYYNIANAYVMLHKYDKAKRYYSKALQLGEDRDARENLAMIALLHDRHDAPLGRERPGSQSDQSEKSDASQTSKNKSTSQKEQSHSGAGSGGETKQKSNPKQKVQPYLEPDKKRPPHPLGSKVYELINKGYIHEKQPW